MRHHYQLKEGKRSQFVDAMRFVRLEADGNYTIFHLVGGGTVTQSQNLKHHLDRLAPLGKFARIHNSHAVNTEHLAEVDGTVITMDDGTQLTLSPAYQKGLWRMLSVL